MMLNESDISEFILELSDREIYNDIRSDTGISNTETVIDEDPTYARKIFHCYTGLPADGKAYRRSFTAAGDNALSWSLGTHSAADYSYKAYHNYYIKIVSQDSSKCTIEYKNTGSLGATLEYSVSYRYKTSEGSSHEVTNYSTLTVRATDDVSIAKYGRRVMNIVWPLGQTQEQMQSLVNSYLERYKEPVPIATITLQGKSDELIKNILMLKISDRVRIIYDLLGLDGDFFVNNLEITHDVQGILEGRYELEYARANEANSIFTLDVSELDGADILG